MESPGTVVLVWVSTRIVWRQQIKTVSFLEIIFSWTSGLVILLQLRNIERSCSLIIALPSLLTLSKSDNLARLLKSKLLFKYFCLCPSRPMTKIEIKMDRVNASLNILVGNQNKTE